MRWMLLLMLAVGCNGVGPDKAKQPVDTGECLVNPEGEFYCIPPSGKVGSTCICSFPDAGK